MKKILGAIAVVAALSSIIPNVYAENLSRIISPNENQRVVQQLNLKAYYADTDDASSGVSWAVREGTCDRNTNTRAGNVDGFFTDYSWDGEHFDAHIDVSGWNPGEYCFVFNPSDDSTRLTQFFEIGRPENAQKPDNQPVQSNTHSENGQNVRNKNSEKGVFYHVSACSSDNIIEPVYDSNVNVVTPEGNKAMIFDGYVNGLAANTEHALWIRTLEGYTGPYIKKYEPLHYYHVVDFTTDGDGNGSFHYDIDAANLPDGDYDIQLALNVDNGTTNGCTVAATEKWINVTTNTNAQGNTEQGPQLIETLFVDATSSTGIDSSNLEDGKKYKFKASGTYRFANWGEYGIADAEWAYRNDSYAMPVGDHGWTLGEDNYPSVYGLDVLVDGENVSWGDFDEGHEYSIVYTGKNSPVHFNIHDSAYSDNQGGIEIQIFEMP